MGSSTLFQGGSSPGTKSGKGQPRPSRPAQGTEVILRPNLKGDAMAPNDILKNLESQKQQARQMGGPDEIARQHQAGKLTARERIDLLFDKGSFAEIGLLAHHQSTHPDMVKRQTPADGC